MFNAARRERNPSHAFASFNSNDRCRRLTRQVQLRVLPEHREFSLRFCCFLHYFGEVFVWRLVSSRFHRAPFVADEMVVSGADSGGVETPEGASSAPGEPPAWPSAADNR